MLSWAFFFVLGCTHIWLFSTFPLTLVASLAILALVFVICRYRYPFTVILALILGLIWPHIYQALCDNASLQNYFEQTTKIEGEVVDFPQVNTKSQSILVKVHLIAGQRAKGLFSPVIKLSWYQLKQRPKIGEHWQWQVKLKAPRGFSNQAGFDYERYLLTKGIVARGYIKNAPLYNKKLREPEALHVSRLRSLVFDALINAKLVYKNYLLALTLGYKKQIPNEEQDLFIDAGVAHLFAISGLHIGIVAWLIHQLSLWLGTNVLSLGVGNKQRLAAIFAVIGAFCYAALAGFSVSSQRALIMIGVYYISQSLRWNFSFLNVLALAVLLVLALNPIQVLSAGFWLSFVAVFVIAISVDSCHSAKRFQVVRMQLALSVGMLPLSALVFQQIAWLSPLVNWLLVPVFSYFLIPLALSIALLASLDMTSLVNIFGAIFDQVIQLSLMFVKALSELVSLSIVLASPWQAIALGLLALCYIMPTALSLIGLGLIALTAMLSANELPQRDPDELQLWVFDVGQGTAVLVSKGEKHLLYDTGFRYPSGLNAGDLILMPELKARYITRLDHLVISHDDIDHRGGYAALAQRLEVDTLWAGQPRRYVDAINCHGEIAWRWGNTHFKFLALDLDRVSNSNDRSCVLRIEHGEHVILLAGDIEKTAESNILRKYKGLKSDVLLVPHHGSATSSSPAFVEAVDPEIAIISVGYRNRYRLPNDEVLKRYRENQTKILRTDRDGQIHLRFGREKSAFQFSRNRIDNARFWTYDKNVSTKVE